MNKEMKTSKVFVGSPAKFLIPALCLASALAVRGASIYWDGGAGGAGGGGNWGTAVNWTTSTISNVDPASPPSTGSDTAVFRSVANNVVTVDANYSLQGMQVQSSTSVSTVLNSSGGTKTISVAGGATQILQNTTLNGIILNKTSGQTFDLSGNLLTFKLNNGSQWNVNATGGTRNGFISAATNRLVTADSGSGSMSVGAGSILVVGSGEKVITIDSPITFSSQGTVKLSGGQLLLGGSSTLSGALDVDAGTTLTASLKNQGTLTANSLTVTKSGSTSGATSFENAGTMTANNLSISSAGSGSTLAFKNSGTLNFAGTLALNVPLTMTAGSIGGVTTSASGTGSVSISGGSLGPAGGNVGELKLPGALSFSGGGYSVNITYSGGADKVSTPGAISLGAGLASLSVTSENVAEGTVFTILQGGSLTGTFAGLADGATISGGAQSYTVNYTGTGVNLTAVPEPAFYAGAVGLGLLGFTVWRRQQKRA